MKSFEIRKDNMRLLIATTLLIAALHGADSLTAGDPGLSVGSTAPGCYAKLIDGGDFFLSRHVGPRARKKLQGPVVFSFFTTFCQPCRKEIPYLHSLKEEYPALGIYLVNVGEDTEKVRNFINKMNYSLPVLLDRYGKISDNYFARVTPTLVLINASGSVEFYKRGFSDADTSLITERIKRLFAD